MLKVKRYDFNKDWTLGKLFINNVHDGFTVEDEIRDIKVKGETAIPYGTYRLSTRISPKFSNSFLYSAKQNILIEHKELIKYPKIKDFKPHELIWVTNVKDFEYILIHWGNTDDDTEGCLIVGDRIGVIGGQSGVLNSRNYYKRFYPKVFPLIKQGGQIITYEKA